MILAIIGSTGLVGKEIIKVLEEENNKRIKKVLFVASKKSTGKKIKHNNQEHKIITIEQAISQKPNYAMFSAGSKVSLKYAPIFSKQGTIVIDNSSCFRMKKNIKLIVPEINGDSLTPEDIIIANPNCSTIQLVMALYPIHKTHTIKRIIVSTYQAVSGSGFYGVEQLKLEERNKKVKKPKYQKNIHRNVIPHCDDINENRYTKEEEKLINETNKILKSKIKITATAVRVPTIGGHGESVNIELKKQTSVAEIINLLKKQTGVFVDKEGYTTPKEVEGSNLVYVSRIRKDQSIKNGFNLWVVADPLRKGAATNAVQILNKMITLMG
tara:strand:- start:469 stop:1446 length:978 start_codon:yes stop_codon:yes gene_type:complete